MSSRLLAMTVALCCVCGGTVAASAQDTAQSAHDTAAARSDASTTGPRGFNFSLGFNIAEGEMDHGRGNGSSSITGFGYGVRLGWAFTPRFGMHLSGDMAAVESADATAHAFASADLIARFSVPGKRRTWVPYVEAGVGRQLVRTGFYDTPDTDTEEPRQLDAYGLSALLGVGCEFVRDSKGAADVGVRFGSGTFRSVTISDARAGDPREVNVRSARIQVVVTGYPFYRRSPR